jgi:ribosome modulation factor
MRTPDGFDKWNPAWRGAYRKGYEAAKAGLSITACPYQDKRKGDGRLTWSRAFQSAWRDGWDAARQDDPLTAYYTDRNNSGQSPLEARP